MSIYSALGRSLFSLLNWPLYLWEKILIQVVLMAKVLDFVCTKVQNEVPNFLIQHAKFSKQCTTKYSTADFGRAGPMDVR